MVYDVITFFDELDLLEIRLNVLDDAVDYFVVAESKETFMGAPKSLHFQDNQSRFDPWKDKIIHFEVPHYPDDAELYKLALASPNTGNKEHWWMREFYQKESVIATLKNCVDDDMIFISDADEIWNPEMEFPQKIETGVIYQPVQEARPFYLNLKSSLDHRNWTGTRFGRYDTVKKLGPNHFRTANLTTPVTISNGGWHFSWLGKVANKWCDSHPDNMARFSLVNSTDKQLEEETLPTYLKKNRGKYDHLFTNSLL